MHDTYSSARIPLEIGVSRQRVGDLEDGNPLRLQLRRRHGRARIDDPLVRGPLGRSRGPPFERRTDVFQTAFIDMPDGEPTLLWRFHEESKAGAVWREDREGRSLVGAVDRHGRARSIRQVENVDAPDLPALEDVPVLGKVGKYEGESVPGGRSRHGTADLHHVEHVVRGERACLRVSRS